MMKKGLTLIELLISMTMIVTISIIISSVYLSGYLSFKENLASSTVESNAQTILDEILLDVKNGMVIEPTYDSYTTGPGTIIIREPAIDAAKNIQYSGTDMLFDTIVYNYTGNAIHKITYADPSSVRYKNNDADTVLDKNILVLNFTYNPDATAPTLVSATISSDITVANHNRKITLTGSARLRNHI